jgi:hypothetical protein
MQNTTQTRQNMPAKIAYTTQAALTAKAKKLGLTARPHMIDSVALLAIETWQKTDNPRAIYERIQHESDRILRPYTAATTISRLIEKLSNKHDCPLLMSYQV